MTESLYSLSPGVDNSSTYGSFYGDSSQVFNNDGNDGFDATRETSRPRRRVTLIADDDGDRQSQNLAQTRSRSVGGRPVVSQHRQMYQQQQQQQNWAAAAGANGGPGNNMVMRNSFHRIPSRRASMNGSFYGQDAAAADPAGSFYRQSSQRGMMNSSFSGGASLYGDLGDGGTGGGYENSGIANNTSSNRIDLSRRSSADDARSTSRSAPPPRRVSLTGPSGASALSGPPNGARGNTYTRVVVTTKHLNARGETVEENEERYVQSEPVTADMQQRFLQQQQKQQQQQQQKLQAAAEAPARRRMQRPTNRAPSAGQRSAPLQRSLSRTMSMRGCMDDDYVDDNNDAPSGRDGGAAADDDGTRTPNGILSDSVGSHHTSPGEDGAQRRLSCGSSERGLGRPAFHSEEARHVVTDDTPASNNSPPDTNPAVASVPQTTPQQQWSATIARYNSMGPAQAGGKAAVPYFMPPQMAYATPQQQQQWMMRMAMMRNGMVPPSAQPPVPQQVSGQAPIVLPSPADPTSPHAVPVSHQNGAVSSGGTVGGPDAAATAPALFPPNHRGSNSGNPSNPTAPNGASQRPSLDGVDPVVLQQQQQQQQLRMMPQQQHAMYSNRMMMGPGAWGPPPVQTPLQQPYMTNTIQRGHSAPHSQLQQPQGQSQQPQAETYRSAPLRRDSIYNQSMMMYPGGGGMGRSTSLYDGNVGGSSLYGDFSGGGGLQRMDSTASATSVYSYGMR